MFLNFLSRFYKYGQFFSKNNFLVLFFQKKRSLAVLYAGFWLSKALLHELFSLSVVYNEQLRVKNKNPFLLACIVIKCDLCTKSEKAFYD